MKIQSILVVLLLLFSLAVTHAQNSDSIFDEGAEEEIRPEEITDDLRMWAENTAIQLKKVLADIRDLNIHEKRKILVEEIMLRVSEAQEKRELLLMRFTLNRSLKLNEIFLQEEDDALVVNYVLIPAVKKAISLYESADLPFLEANRGRVFDDQIKVPPYAAFTKANINWLLTVSNVHPSYQGQFKVLLLSVVWVIKDLLRSPEAKRNPSNANIILDLKNIYFKYKQSSGDEIDYSLNNRIRKALLKVHDEIVVEKDSEKISDFIGRALPQSKHKAKGLLSYYLRSQFELFQIGAGHRTIWRKKENGSYGNRSEAIHLSINSVNYHDSNEGYEGYVLKSEFNFGDDDVAQHNLKSLGGRIPFLAFPDKTIAIGPYGNLFEYRRDKMRRTENFRVLDVGLSSMIKPVNSNNFSIDIYAYLTNSDHIRLLGFDRSDASPEFEADLRKMEQEQLNLQQQGGNKYFPAAHSTEGFNKRDVEGFRSYTLKLTCTLNSSLAREDDFVFQCGGYFNADRIEDISKKKLPSTHQNVYDDKVERKGGYVSLQYRLWDSKEWNLDKTELVTIGRGPILDLTYQIDDDPLGQQLVSFFNPKKAKGITAETRALTINIQWTF